MTASRAGELLIALVEPLFWAIAFLTPLSIAWMNVGLGILTGVLVLLAASGYEMPWRRAIDASFQLVCVYVAVGALVSLAGVAPLHSLRLLPKEFHKLWVLFILNLALALRPSPRAYLAFSAGMAAIALVGIFQVADAMLWGAHGLDRTVLVIRAHGFVHPVTYANMLGMGFIGVVCFFIHGSPGIGPLKAERLWPVLLLVSGAALILSQTRTVLLAVAAATALMSLRDKRLRPWVFVVLGCLAAAAILRDYWDTGGAAVRGILTRLDFGAGHSDAEGLRMRSTLWSVAWRMFQDHPWTGVGLGNYRTLFTDYFQGMLDRQAVWGDAHNLYLHQLAERGLLGLTALCAFFGHIAASVWRRSRSIAGPAGLWALGAVATFLLANITETAFESEQPATLFLCIWAWTQANGSDRPVEGFQG